MSKAPSSQAVPLVGEIAGISLSELLQVAALAGERSLLQIRSGTQTAWIGFEAGAIVRVARSDPAPGGPGPAGVEPAGAKPASRAPDGEADDGSLADAETQLLDLIQSYVMVARPVLNAALWKLKQWSKKRL